MTTMTASEARKNLPTPEPGERGSRRGVRITSKAGIAVLLSEDDYEAWQTTRHLFSTPPNARRLLGSTQEWHTRSLVTEALPDDAEGDE